MSYNVLGGLQVARPTTTSPKYMDLEVEALDTMAKDLNLKEEKQEGEFKIDTANFSQVLNEYYKQAEKHQKKVWEREDTALQRASEDARKAGIDPNLVGLEPAATTSTFSENLNTGLTSNLDRILEDLENEFKKEENSKDRQTEKAGKLLMGLLSVMAAIIVKA